MTGGSSHSGSTNVKKLKSIVKPNLQLVTPGFNQTDFLMLKILSNMMFMSMEYFRQMQISKIKHATVKRVIDFGVDIIQVKTY